MKKTILILGIAAAAMAVSCNKSEQFIDDDGTTVFTGDKAYVTVLITDAGSSGTRAGDTTDGGYENGTASERDVARAEFYFYDHFGEYVTSATVWDGGNENTTDENIEFNAYTVIVLDNLNGYRAPMYLVTVLNPDQNFKPETHLSDLQTQYSNASDTNGGLYRSDKNANDETTNFFTMTTTSFGGQNIKLEDGSYSPYFVSVVTDENFQKEPITDATAIENPVIVYVERLAAKVEVGLGADLTGETVTYGGETVTMYPLRATIAGDENAQDDPTDDEGAEDIYVYLEGWKLNATSKQSYICKNIDESWDLGTFKWNDPDYYRSYWAMSPSYGWTSSPTSAKGTSGNLTESTEATEWSNYYLNYVSLDSGLLDFDDNNYTYCAENTNTVSEETIKSTNSSLLTTVLVKARICRVTDGVAADLENVVRYEGVLWDEDRYINYVLSHTNVYYDTGETYTDADGNTHNIYNLIDKSFADAYLKETSDAVMYVYINNTTGPYYTLSAAGEATTCGYDDLQAKLDEYNYDFQAIGYTDGQMYYSIPIEHLRKDHTTSSTATDPATGEEVTVDVETLYEANYGVVRNHYYKITIDSLVGLGKGISDSTEIIVPGDQDEFDTYAVGATINILSWRVVEQHVDL